MNNFLQIYILLFLIISCNNTDEAIIQDPKSISDSLVKSDIKTKIIAHRGYWNISGSAQNSIKAITLAYENRLNGAEFDIRMSKDSILYLVHDDKFRGYTIRNTNSDILDKLILNNGEKFPRLEELLEEVKHYNNFIFYVEVKESGNDQIDLETTKQVINKLTQYNLIDKSILLSFGIGIIKHSESLNSNLKTLYIIQNVNTSNLEQYKKIGIDYLGISYQSLLNNVDLINVINSKGFMINAWTVNDIEKIKTLKKYKINSISTDIPIQAIEIN